MEKLQMLLNERAEKQQLIQRADTKASAIFVVMSIFFPTFITLSTKIVGSISRIVLVLLFLLFFVIALVFSVLVLIPREKGTGVFYIKNNKKLTFDQYKKQINELNNQETEEVLTMQNYVLNNILVKKNKNLKYSFFSLIGFITVIVIIIFVTIL